ncbi:hypothetical protein ACFY1P_30830 [Streptomyces sp. NPDC001407]|uniref:hypothetical protein n=1 Tax=Streptomyces sp. NPDC001407 TaxID=3364573 RepID=UPI0036740801
MTTWGLIVETTVGTGDRKHTSGSVMAHLEGSRDEALRELETRARHYTPQHPMSARRSRLFRTTDGFDLVVDGVWDTFLTRFTVAELLRDSDAPPPPLPSAEAPSQAPEETPDEPVEPRPSVADAAPCDADGVPVKPSWLGRADLP